VFKSIARTVLTCGFPVLLTATDKVWDQGQIIHNKAIRAALGLPSYTSLKYIYQLTNIPRIKPFSITLLQPVIAKANSNNDKLLENHFEGFTSGNIEPNTQTQTMFFYILVFL